MPGVLNLPACLAWRHPVPRGVQGRCLGQTDVPIDRRKAKRLAHRIRHAARQGAWPRTVYTSPLQRCAAVGRELRRWGWRHHVDPALMEMDFGTWDGQHWSHIAEQDVAAWCQDFAEHAPGGGESLRTVMARVAAWRPAAGTDGPHLIVAHAGWMLSRRCWALHGGPVTDAALWPRAPAYGERWAFDALSVPQGA